MATQINTPDAADAQYPAFTGFQTQDPRTISYNDAAALMPLIYGVQINQLQCEILKIQEVVSAFAGFPWIDISSDTYTILTTVASGTTFIFTSTNPNVDITLPLVSALAAGTKITLIPGYASTAPEFFTNAADTIYYVNLSGQSMILNPFNAITLIADGVDKWIVVSGVPDVIA